MKTVVICGDCGDKELTREIVSACSRSGGALVCDGDRIYSTCESPGYLIFSMCTLSDLYVPGCIIVLGKALIQIRRDIDLRDCVCIADAGCPESLRFAADVNANVLGCSMSGHDSLSISSFGEDGTAVVSLNRSVSLGSSTVEPREIIMSWKERDNIYPTLAAAAVLLLGEQP